MNPNLIRQRKSKAGSGKDSVRTLTCPHCGHQFEMPLATFERQLLKAVRKLERHSGTASAKAVAGELYMSAAHARRCLAKLEQTGQVKRMGYRGGWKTAA